MGKEHKQSVFRIMEGGVKMSVALVCDKCGVRSQRECEDLDDAILQAKIYEFWASVEQADGTWKHFCWKCKKKLQK